MAEYCFRIAEIWVRLPSGPKCLTGQVAETPVRFWLGKRGHVHFPVENLKNLGLKSLIEIKSKNGRQKMDVSLFLKFLKPFSFFGDWV